MSVPKYSSNNQCWANAARAWSALTLSSRLQRNYVPWTSCQYHYGVHMSLDYNVLFGYLPPGHETGLHAHCYESIAIAKCDMSFLIENRLLNPMKKPVEFTSRTFSLNAGNIAVYSSPPTRFEPFVHRYTTRNGPAAFFAIEILLPSLPRAQRVPSMSVTGLNDSDYKIEQTSHFHAAATLRLPSQTNVQLFADLSRCTPPAEPHSHIARLLCTIQGDFNCITVSNSVNVDMRQIVKQFPAFPMHAVLIYGIPTTDGNKPFITHVYNGGAEKWCGVVVDVYAVIPPSYKR